MSSSGKTGQALQKDINLNSDEKGMKKTSNRFAKKTPFTMVLGRLSVKAVIMYDQSHDIDNVNDTHKV